MSIIARLDLAVVSEVRCIGECGLDYSEGFPAADKQLPYFERQVQLACEVSPTRKHRDVVNVESSMGCLFSGIK